MAIEQKKIDQIIRSFQKSYETVGYTGTSLNTIARDLHISKKTIYKLFDTKQAILDEVIHQKAKRFGISLERKVKEQLTDRKKIEWLISTAIELTRKQLKKSKSKVKEYKIFLYHSAYNEALFRTFQNCIEDGTRRNVFAVKDLDLTVQIIRSIVACADQLVAAKPDINVEPEIKRTIMKLLMP
jgi:AcrR family transcriptional regulator